MMGTRILVVDDDAGIRESLQDLFSLDDFECTVAATGAEGLAMLESTRPELVVTDIELPDMSGFQLCQTLKKQPSFRHIPVVMMSGNFTEMDDKLQGFELGADEFFTKPFDPLYFVSRIKSILRQHVPPPEAIIA